MVADPALDRASCTQDTTTPQQSFLRSVAQVFRFEYIAAAIPGVSITFFLCASTPADLLSAPVIEGLAVILLMIFAGLGLNAAVDYDIDRQYATFKRRIPTAIERIGPRRVWFLIAAQTAIAVVLGGHISLHFQSWLPLALIALEAIFYYGYSLPPLQFKLRGVLSHAVSLILGTTFIPFVLSAYTYLGTVTWPLFVFLVGFGLVQYGWEFSNQALDYLEDKAEGLRTPAVRLGVVRSMTAALLVPLAGMAIAFAGLFFVLHQRWQPFGHLVPFFALVGTWLLAVAIMLASYFVPLRNTWRMLRLCQREPPEQCVPKLPELCRYAQWQASSVLGAAAGTAVVYLASNYAWAA